MTVHMNVKCKEGRFRGDLPKWSASVTGASYYFTSKLEKLLDIHGFAPFAVEPGRSTWTLKPSICQPPLYLATILKSQYNGQLSAQVSSMLDWWEDALWASGFLRANGPVGAERSRAEAAMTKLRRLVVRAAPTEGEASLLRGALRALVEPKK